MKVISNTNIFKYVLFSDTKCTILLMFFSFAAYVNTLKNGFVYDDYLVIKENTFVNKGISGIPEILSTSYYNGFSRVSDNLYRPASLVLFAVEHQLFNNTPLPYHLVNILLFIGCVLLLFLFLNILFENKIVAFNTALLFALHPIHTEVVANIKSCDELLCFIFAFLSLNIFIKYSQKGNVFYLILGGLSYLLSLLSKETTITFLFIFPLIFFFYKTEYIKRSITIMCVITLVILIFIFLRYVVLNRYMTTVDNANISVIDNPLVIQNLSFESRIATAFLVLGHYLKLLFFPYPLVSDYSYNSIPLVDFYYLQVWISLCIYISLTIFSIRCLFKTKRNPYAFGILFFLITTALISNIFFHLGTIMGERLMFFPSIGFCLILALFIQTPNAINREVVNNKYTNKRMLFIIIPIMIIFLILTINRNSDWQSNFTLFSADIKTAPRSSKLNYNLGRELIVVAAANENDDNKKENIKNEGIRYLSTAISIYPDYEYAHRLLCEIYFRNQIYDSAEVHGLKAINLKPNEISILNNLGGVYFYRKMYIKTIAICREEIDLEPTNALPYANIGLCYFKLNSFDSAIYYSNQAISINDTLELPYRTLKETYKLMAKKS